MTHCNDHCGIKINHNFLDYNVGREKETYLNRNDQDFKTKGKLSMKWNYGGWRGDGCAINFTKD